MARAYDAGVRVNQDNSFSYFDPQCRVSDGVVVPRIDAPREMPRATIASHEGQFDVANTPADRNWNFVSTDAVLKIEIVRN